MSWFRQSYRHSLAAKGIRTSFATARVPYHPQVAMERFDLDKLELLGQGRDRTTFTFKSDPTKVLKLAHNPTGIRQNQMELEEIGVKPLYFGKDFVVMQRAKPFEAQDDESAEIKNWRLKRARLKQLERLLEKMQYEGGEPESTQEERLLKVLGLEDIVNYPNIGVEDVSKPSSWGVLPNRRMVLIDKGGLDFETFNPDVSAMERWEDIVERRTKARQLGREPLVYLVDRSTGKYVPGTVWNVKEFMKVGDISDQWSIRPKVPQSTLPTITTAMEMFE